MADFSAFPAMAGELLDVLEPTLHDAGRRAILWLLRAGLAVAI
jgi:hypothetical protein